MTANKKAKIFLLLLLSTLANSQELMEPSSINLGHGLINCNGKIAVCVGPLMYKNCVSDSKGIMYANGGAKRCPTNSRCVNDGVEICVPLKTSTDAPVKETIVNTTSPIVIVGPITEGPNSAIILSSGIPLTEQAENSKAPTETTVLPVGTTNALFDTNSTPVETTPIPETSQQETEPTKIYAIEETTAIPLDTSSLPETSIISANISESINEDPNSVITVSSSEPLTEKAESSKTHAETTVLPAETTTALFDTNSTPVETTPIPETPQQETEPTTIYAIEETTDIPLDTSSLPETSIISANISESINEDPNSATTVSSSEPLTEKAESSKTHAETTVLPAETTTALFDTNSTPVETTPIPETPQQETEPTTMFVIEETTSVPFVTSSLAETEPLNFNISKASTPLPQTFTSEFSLETTTVTEQETTSLALDSSSQQESFIADINNVTDSVNQSQFTIFPEKSASEDNKITTVLPIDQTTFADTTVLQNSTKVDELYKPASSYEILINPASPSPDVSETEATDFSESSTNAIFTTVAVVETTTFMNDTDFDLHNSSTVEVTPNTPYELNSATNTVFLTTISPISTNTNNYEHISSQVPIDQTVTPIGQSLDGNVIISTEENILEVTTLIPSLLEINTESAPAGPNVTSYTPHIPPSDWNVAEGSNVTVNTELLTESVTTIYSNAAVYQGVADNSNSSDNSNFDYSTYNFTPNNVIEPVDPNLADDPNIFVGSNAVSNVNTELNSNIANHAYVTVNGGSTVIPETTISTSKVTPSISSSSNNINLSDYTPALDSTHFSINPNLEADYTTSFDQNAATAASLLTNGDSTTTSNTPSSENDTNTNATVDLNTSNNINALGNTNVIDGNSIRSGDGSALETAVNSSGLSNNNELTDANASGNLNTVDNPSGVDSLSGLIHFNTSDSRNASVSSSQFGSRVGFASSNQDASINPSGLQNRSDSVYDTTEVSPVASVNQSGQKIPSSSVDNSYPLHPEILTSTIDPLFNNRLGNANTSGDSNASDNPSGLGSPTGKTNFNVSENTNASVNPSESQNPSGLVNGSVPVNSETLVNSTKPLFNNGLVNTNTSSNPDASDSTSRVESPTGKADFNGSENPNASVIPSENPSSSVDDSIQVNPKISGNSSALSYNNGLADDNTSGKPNTSDNPSGLGSPTGKVDVNASENPSASVYPSGIQNPSGSAVGNIPVNPETLTHSSEPSLNNGLADTNVSSSPITSDNQSSTGSLNFNASANPNASINKIGLESISDSVLFNPETLGNSSGQSNNSILTHINDPGYPKTSDIPGGSAPVNPDPNNLPFSKTAVAPKTTSYTVNTSVKPNVAFNLKSPSDRNNLLETSSSPSDSNSLGDLSNKPNIFHRPEAPGNTNLLAEPSLVVSPSRTKVLNSKNQENAGTLENVSTDSEEDEDDSNTTSEKTSTEDKNEEEKQEERKNKKDEDKKRKKEEESKHKEEEKKKKKEEEKKKKEKERKKKKEEKEQKKKIKEEEKRKKREKEDSNEKNESNESIDEEELKNHREYRKELIKNIRKYIKNNDCGEDDIYPDVNDCKKYYRCLKKSDKIKIIHLHCENNKKFDFDDKKCVDKEDAQCLFKE